MEVSLGIPPLPSVNSLLSKQKLRRQRRIEYLLFISNCMHVLYRLGC